MVELQINNELRIFLPERGEWVQVCPDCGYHKIVDGKLFTSDLLVEEREAVLGEPHCERPWQGMKIPALQS